MTPDCYNTVATSSIAEYKEKGSRFIAFVIPTSTVHDFKENLTRIKKEHPKATHHCFAYRMGPDGGVHRVNDDGEPSGTAGRPILGQIDSRQLTDVSIIVVRYFGGTQLGVAGLFNAYKNAAALALQLTPSVQRPVLFSYSVKFDYALMNEIMGISKQFDCQASQMKMDLSCSLVLQIPKKSLDDVLQKLAKLKVVEVEKIG